MNTNDISVYLTVYKTRSFSKAARELYMSPQGVVKVIQRLEDEFGTKLFSRTSKGVIPTASGDILYGDTLHIYKEYSDLRKKLNPEEIKTNLRFLYTQGIMSYLSITFLDAYASDHKDINLITEEMSDRFVLNSILDNSADIGIITGPVNDKRLQSRSFASMRFVLVVNTGSPLASMETIGFADLDNQKLALLSHNCFPYAQLMRRIKEAGASPCAVYEADQLPFNHERASKNGCVGQSIDFVAKHICYENTVCKYFSDETFTWDTCFIWKDENPNIGHIKEFITYTENWKQINNIQLALKP